MNNQRFLMRALALAFIPSSFSTVALSESLIESRPSFKARLFENPGELTGCDRSINLELTNGTNGLVAILGEQIFGSCEIYIPRHVRAYGLKAQADDCGSHRYVDEETEGELIDITDHRTSVCKDLQPHQIVVSEVRNERLEKFAGQVLNENLEVLTYTGTLVADHAIGGETTGYGIEVSDQVGIRIIELDLETNGLQGLFHSLENLAVVVKGSFTIVSGVETGSRQVLVVSELKLQETR